MSFIVTLSHLHINYPTTLCQSLCTQLSHHFNYWCNSPRTKHDEVAVNMLDAVSSSA
jgi:hypothetical protein